MTAIACTLIATIGAVLCAGLIAQAIEDRRR